MNFFVLILWSSIVFGGKDDPKYPVNSIKPEILEGMYAVVRDRDESVEINAWDQAVVRYKIAVTILNSKADLYAQQTIWYDPFHTIKSFKGTVYDANGNVIKKLKTGEIRDRSYFDEVSLFTDTRVKEVDLTQSVYPYTVEFEYEILKKMLYSIPDFYLYTDDEVSVEEATFTVSYPAEYKPRYKLFQVNEPAVSVSEGKQVMTWSFKDVKPRKFEKNDPPLARVVPNIQMAPDHFIYDGYAGRMNTWNNLAKWQQTLNAGRIELPEETKNKLIKMVESIPNKEEKVKALYSYLQSRTRYVGVQLGIGGLQPIPASVVDKVGYGDCKALSNYMIAMLNCVGIKGYYAKINAGAGASPVDESFPSHQFNHVIVAVPMESDTAWLECTSQTNPYRYLGSFTGNRKALLVTENGGALVNTIRYPDDGNQQIRIATIELSEDGNAVATTKTSYTGILHERNNLSQIIRLSREEQLKWINKNTNVPSFDLNGFEMELSDEKAPKVIVNIQMNLPRFGAKTNKRLVFSPNFSNKSSYLPSQQEQRINPIVVHTGYVEYDSVTFRLPENFKVEFLPQDENLVTDFGSYSIAFKVEGQLLIYSRRLHVRQGEFASGSYPEYVRFYRSLQRHDNIKVVLLSKT